MNDVKITWSWFCFFFLGVPVEREGKELHTLLWLRNKEGKSTERCTFCLVAGNRWKVTNQNRHNTPYSSLARETTTWIPMTYRDPCRVKIGCFLFLNARAQITTNYMDLWRTTSSVWNMWWSSLTCLLSGRRTELKKRVSLKKKHKKKLLSWYQVADYVLVFSLMAGTQVMSLRWEFSKIIFVMCLSLLCCTEM